MFYRSCPLTPDVDPSCHLPQWKFGSYAPAEESEEKTKIEIDIFSAYILATEGGSSIEKQKVYL
jgi:hypothetical protein